MPNKAKKNAYPKQTHGSKLAAKARKMANSLSYSERERLYNKGMVMIYSERIP
ncbi:MAG: hypothetical protein WCD79_04480 [Chthoniobacteraceae bacterium]